MESTRFSFCFRCWRSRHGTPFVKANKMREIINGLPVDVDALMARLEKKCDDMGMHEGSLAKKKKGRERTVQGALAELQL